MRLRTTQVNKPTNLLQPALDQTSVNSENQSTLHNIPTNSTPISPKPNFTTYISSTPSASCKNQQVPFRLLPNQLLGTIQENEDEFPFLNKPNKREPKVAQYLLEKFFIFMKSLCENLLSVDFITNKFKDFVATLNLNETRDKQCVIRFL